MEDLEKIEPTPWDAGLDAEWNRQMSVLTTASPLARSTMPQPKGRTLWLVVRRSLLMVIAAFDAQYGIETKRR